MNKNQIKNYNKMFQTLKRIGRQYQTPRQLKRNSDSEYGLEYSEALEMAYENIQQEAKSAIKGMREIKTKESDGN